MVCSSNSVDMIVIDRIRFKVIFFSLNSDWKSSSLTQNSSNWATKSFRMSYLCDICNIYYDNYDYYWQYWQCVMIRLLWWLGDTGRATLPWPPTAEATEAAEVNRGMVAVNELEANKCSSANNLKITSCTIIMLSNTILKVPKVVTSLQETAL